MTVKKFRTTPSLLSTVVFMLTVFIVTLCGSGVTYGLNHSGNITSDETWSAAGNPHIVIGNIHVYNTAKLRIEPGCLVKFDAGTALYIGYFSDGALNAEGTSINPIIFTSNASTPTAGDWQGIVFYNSTVDASTILDHCTVEYGGYGSNNSNINCDNASPTIQNCTIRYSDGYGIYCDNNSAPTLTNNTISNNGSFPISLYCNNLDTSVTGNTGSGNGANAIEVRGGDMTTSHTWIKQDFYFNVTGNIHVRDGATLTINPGCLVKFDAATGLYIGYYSPATLNAVGTSLNPITFTSNAATPAAGDWQGIVFFNSTDDSATIMDYCTVEYGGYGSNNSNINCDNASPTIQNCTIRYSDGYGIYCDNGSAPTLTNNTISNNGSFPISEYCSMLDSNVTGNTGSGNTPNAIEVRGTNITSSHTWVKQDFYVNVTGDIHVRDGATLTINPGCLVKFDADIGLYIGYYSAATLIAVGTDDAPITFTSNKDTPAVGDWQGIVFYNSTVDASAILDHCTVEYGGYGSHNSNINCDAASPTIQNCTIRHSDGYGIYSDNTAAPTLTNNTISNNGSFPISLYCNNLDTNVTGNTGSGNGANAIEVRGGDITSSHTWIKQDFYFNVTGNIHVSNESSDATFVATLTINPGSLVKFNTTTALYIGYYGGAALIAGGTSGNPITFTSNASTPAAGDWQGIVFYNSTVDASTIMDHCTVEYGGYGSNNSNIDCNLASPTIQNCIIRNSDGYGIYTTGSDADPWVSCSTITNNTHGVYVNGGNPAIVDCRITGNTDFGVYNSNSSITIDAENNWWGDSSGPGGAGPGTGNAVSDYVDFDPWLTSFDSCLDTIVLSPASGSNIVGSQHTVTATVEDDAGEPVEGIVLFFYITSGPHTGLNGNATTDVHGMGTFTYTGTQNGTDTIEASFADFHGRTRTSNSVTMTWGPVNNPPEAICRDVRVSADANCSADVSIDNGSYDPDSEDTISVSQSPAGPYALGDTPVTLTVTDNHGASSSCQATVTVVDDTPPIITLNGNDPMTVECHTSFTDPGATAEDNCASAVNVTTSGSVDPNTVGTYTITYSATDGTNTVTKTRTVNVVDTAAPVITPKPSITYWSPDHKYQTVTMSQMVQGVSDSGDSMNINDVVIEQVTSDEPDNVRGDSDGNTKKDIVIAANCKSVQLRAERDGLKNGRVYVITLRVRDVSGNEGRAEFKVIVPLNKSHPLATQDAVAYTVTSSCF